MNCTEHVKFSLRG